MASGPARRERKVVTVLFADLVGFTARSESLDPEEVHRFVSAMEPMDELLRTSGHYGPRVPVPDDADEQTRMIAFVGRQPLRD